MTILCIISFCYGIVYCQCYRYDIVCIAGKGLKIVLFFFYSPDDCQLIGHGVVKVPNVLCLFS